MILSIYTAPRGTASLLIMLQPYKSTQEPFEKSKTPSLGCSGELGQQ